MVRALKCLLVLTSFVACSGPERTTSEVDAREEVRVRQIVEMLDGLSRNELYSLSRQIGAKIVEPPPGTLAPGWGWGNKPMEMEYTIQILENNGKKSVSSQGSCCMY